MQPAFDRCFGAICYRRSKRFRPAVLVSASRVAAVSRAFTIRGKSDAGRLVANGRESHLHISRPSEILVDGKLSRSADLSAVSVQP